MMQMKSLINIMRATEALKLRHLGGRLEFSLKTDLMSAAIGKGT
jgi:hypothetical protein